MGTFFLAQGIGGMVCALPTGLLVDRVSNPHRLLASGMVLRGVSFAAVPFITSFPVLCVVGAVQGASLPLVGVAVRTAIVWNKGTSSGGMLNLAMGSFGRWFLI